MAPLSFYTKSLKVTFETTNRSKYNFGDYGEDFLHSYEGSFHFLGCEERSARDCNIFVTSMKDVHDRIRSVYYISSSSLLRVFGVGEVLYEGKPRYLIVTEQFESTLASEFQNKNYTKKWVGVGEDTLGRGSFDENDFLKDGVCTILRSVMTSFGQFYESDMLAALSLKIDTLLTFLVKGKVKFLFMGPTKGSLHVQVQEFMKLFRGLLDRGNGYEQTDFYGMRAEDFVSPKGCYHPFVMFHEERIKLGLFRDKIRSRGSTLVGYHYRESSNFIDDQYETWISKLKAKKDIFKLFLLYNPQTKNLRTEDQIKYNDTLDSFLDYLRNLATHVRDGATHDLYRRYAKKGVPSYKEMNTELRKLLGQKFLVCIWRRTEDEDYRIF